MDPATATAWRTMTMSDLLPSDPAPHLLLRMQGYVGVASGVVVEGDCFFGAQVVVRGTEVGAGAVVGARAVVVGGVAPGTMVRSVPAR